EADIGVAGGKGTGLIFKKGKAVKKVPADKIVEELVKEVFSLAAEEKNSR
ncbi:MAG TPA: 4-hydroxy-3-methylbut-2-en-1-yl diphosphate synthase, partial [Acidobacteria bacterium]|nr:4-hydroxy-3-methylbut-2-en-1-yl diphosphate synthase [Acidobacteriota bacterium]